MTWQDSHLEDSNNIGEAALQEVSIHKDSKCKTSTTVTINNLANEPGTCKKSKCQHPFEQKQKADRAVEEDENDTQREHTRRG